MLPRAAALAGALLLTLSACGRAGASGDPLLGKTLVIDGARLLGRPNDAPVTFHSVAIDGERIGEAQRLEEFQELRAGRPVLRPQVALVTQRAPVHVEATRADDFRALNGVFRHLDTRLPPGAARARKRRRCCQPRGARRGANA